MASKSISRNAVVMTSPLQSELVSRPISFDGLAPDQLLVETEYTVISAGTEMAIYQGIESWAKLPFEPGYGNVGHVVEAGRAIADKYAPGDRVMYYGPHASINVAGGFFVKIPDDVTSRIAPLAARIGQVAFTSRRVSTAELGDYVVVQGLGLVGNLAAQLFRLSGARVIGLDVSRKRLDVAKSVGIEHVVNSAEGNVVDAVREITGGEMAQTVVEATGIPTLTGVAAGLVGTNGEVVLLGTPRGTYEGNAGDLLMKVHVASPHVTLKGALEWIYPYYPAQGCKHSLFRNVTQLLELTGSGALHVDELISHVIQPEETPGVYQELYKRNEDYFGVVIDWTSSRK
ncbi:MAG: zinc-binding alcohol dehydrogenase [Capsulimonadaceae bacterium]|nr:zinc-binding alcohol dehydrogenase [Capsulimonadaceae bacterium]